MAHKAGSGYIAPFPEDSGFTVTESRKGKDRYHSPTGVYLHGSGASGVYMDYAGLSLVGSTFELPTDPRLLRDIAEAIIMIAEEIEEDRGIRPRR